MWSPSFLTHIHWSVCTTLTTATLHGLLQNTKQQRGNASSRQSPCSPSAVPVTLKTKPTQFCETGPSKGQCPEGHSVMKMGHEIFRGLLIAFLRISGYFDTSRIVFFWINHIQSIFVLLTYIYIYIYYTIFFFFFIRLVPVPRSSNIPPAPLPPKNVICYVDQGSEAVVMSHGRSKGNPDFPFVIQHGTFSSKDSCISNID